MSIYYVPDRENFNSAAFKKHYESSPLCNRIDVEMRGVFSKDIIKYRYKHV